MIHSKRKIGLKKIIINSHRLLRIFFFYVGHFLARHISDESAASLLGWAVRLIGLCGFPRARMSWKEPGFPGILLSNPHSCSLARGPSWRRGRPGFVLPRVAGSSPLHSTPRHSAPQGSSHPVRCHGLELYYVLCLTFRVNVTCVVLAKV